MSNAARPPEDDPRFLPEYVPLPTLPTDIEYDLAVVITNAKVQLYDELNLIWASSFPDQIPTDDQGNLLVHVDPSRFFPPFIAYGIKYYDAYVHALLRLKPRLSDYSAWVNFALKTLVCDELVPYRPPGERNQQLSQWQLHMGSTWRLFDHPNHFALSPMAQALINILEDAMDPFWDTFHGTLHNAISRRTLLWQTEGLKQLRPAQSRRGTSDAALGLVKAEVRFPKRAQWLADCLGKRGWNRHDLARFGGPDNKTGKKILDGLAVREDVLIKTAHALSQKGAKVTVVDIPPD